MQKKYRYHLVDETLAEASKGFHELTAIYKHVDFEKFFANIVLPRRLDKQRISTMRKLVMALQRG